MVDEKLRAEMTKTYASGDKEKALRLSHQLDKQILEEYKIKCVINKTANIAESIERFYKNGKEGLYVAEEAIKEIQKIEGYNHVPTGTGEVDWRRRNEGIRTIGIGISTEFIQKGYIDLRGRKFNSPQELAALAQVYRDPRFETLRFIYTKGNIIVGHEGITSKLPASSVAFLNLPERDKCKDENEFTRKIKTAEIRFFMDIVDRMERLKADGYYLLHNHCSGIDVSPSKEDIDLTEVYHQALSGFKGHVIINSNQYSFIDQNLCVSINRLYMGKDELLEPSLPHPLLGEYIKSTQKLAHIAKTMQLESKYSVVLYISAKNMIRAIQEVPDGIFNNENECVNFLRGRMTEYGASRAFVVTGSQQVKEMASGMVKKGYLLDAVITDSNYNVTSIRETGVDPSELNEVHWMSRQINRGFRVNEEKCNDYSIYRNREPKTARSDKGKSTMPGIGL